ncbi:MAG: bifunctional precorrin-2 dehydrogenase/sirohydrochlorin ferrochelatase [Deinococcales bacterium]
MSDLEQRKCLVVGGGKIAERKCQALIEAGAKPLVISPSLNEGLKALWGQGFLNYLCRPFEVKDLEGKFLVIAATNDKALNSAIATQCKLQGILVNQVSEASEGNCHTPATLRHEGVLLSISTNGQPKLSKCLKENFKGILAALVGASREAITQSNLMR